MWCLLLLLLYSFDFLAAWPTGCYHRLRKLFGFLMCVFFFCGCLYSEYGNNPCDIWRAEIPNGPQSICCCSCSRSQMEKHKNANTIIVVFSPNEQQPNMKYPPASLRTQQKSHWKRNKLGPRYAHRTHRKTRRGNKTKTTFSHIKRIAAAKGIFLCVCVCFYFGRWKPRPTYASETLTMGLYNRKKVRSLRWNFGNFPLPYWEYSECWIFEAKITQIKANTTLHFIEKRKVTFERKKRNDQGKCHFFSRPLSKTFTFRCSKTSHV